MTHIASIIDSGQCCGDPTYEISFRFNAKTEEIYILETDEDYARRYTGKMSPMQIKEFVNNAAGRLNSDKYCTISKFVAKYSVSTAP